MSNFIETFIRPGLINGLCYGIAAIGISLPLRFLRAADFTAVGAIMVGGVVTIYMTNASDWWVIGLSCGSIVAGLLGVFTAFLSLTKWLNIPLMLAGIISFTASQSLGLAITGGASIDLPNTIHFLSATFSWFDASIVLAIGLTVSIVGGILARSKWGCFAFAMCGSSNFVKFRHRNSDATTYCLLFISNLLVGLCGGLIVLKTRTAYSAINMEFLSLTLGAIFSGDAVVQLFARLLKKEVPIELTSDIRSDTPTHRSDYLERFRLSLSAQRDDSERIWFIFLSYILASIVLNDVAVAVRGQAFLDVSPAWEHVVVAIIIIMGLLVSNLKLKSK